MPHRLLFKPQLASIGEPNQQTNSETKEPQAQQQEPAHTGSNDAGCLDAAAQALPPKQDSTTLGGEQQTKHKQIIVRKANSRRVSISKDRIEPLPMHSTPQPTTLSVNCKDETFTSHSTAAAGTGAETESDKSPTHLATAKAWQASTPKADQGQSGQSGQSTPTALPMIPNQALHRNKSEQQQQQQAASPRLSLQQSQANPLMVVTQNAYLNATSPNSGGADRLRGRRHSMSEARVMVPWFDPVSDTRLTSTARASLPSIQSKHAQQSQPTGAQTDGTNSPSSNRRFSKVDPGQTHQPDSPQHTSSFVTLSNEAKLVRRDSISVVHSTHSYSAQSRQSAAATPKSPISPAAETPGGTGATANERLGPAQLAKATMSHRRTASGPVDYAFPQQQQQTQQTPKSMTQQLSLQSRRGSLKRFDLAQACDDAQKVWHHYSRLSKHHPMPKELDDTTDAAAAAAAAATTEVESTNDTPKNQNADNDSNKAHMKTDSASASGDDRASCLRELTSYQVRQLAQDLHSYYSTQLRCMAAIEHPNFTQDQIEDCVARHLKASFDSKKDAQQQQAQIERLIRANLATKPSAFDSASSAGASRPIEKLHFIQHWAAFLRQYFDVDVETQRLREASISCAIM